MNINDFFDKANKVYEAGLKVLNKVVGIQEDQLQSRIRTSSNEQLEAMAKKLSHEGGSPKAEAMLYEEMRRRRMV